MTNIRLILKIGRFRGESMSLKILANNQLVSDNESFDNDRVDINFDVDLPAVVKFEVSGKTQFDTEVDSDGRILQDKHILIEGVCIDDVWVEKWVLASKFFHPTGSNYFGQNKTYWFEIPYTDIMDFWLDCLAVDQ